MQEGFMSSVLHPIAPTLPRVAYTSHAAVHLTSFAQALPTTVLPWMFFHAGDETYPLREGKLSR